MTGYTPLADLVKDICMGPAPSGHRVDWATFATVASFIAAARQVGVTLTPYDARILACAATEAALTQLAGGRAR